MVLTSIESLKTDICSCGKLGDIKSLAHERFSSIEDDRRSGPVSMAIENRVGIFLLCRTSS